MLLEWPKKSHSLTHEISACKATIFFVQETNLKKNGRYINKEYEIFESIRKNKEKGGTMLGIHKSLNPVLVEEYSKTFELIVTVLSEGRRQRNKRDVRIWTSRELEGFRQNALLCSTRRGDIKSPNGWQIHTN